MKKIYYILIVILLVALSVSCSRKNREIATFDGGSVLQKDVDFYLAKLPLNQVKEYTGSLENLKKVVEDIADKKIVYTFVKKTNLINFSVISNELEQYKRRSVVNYMMTALNLSKEASIKSSDLKKFTTYLTIKIIWLKTFDGMSDKELKQIEKYAKSIRKKIKKGADFGMMANKYSDDPGNFKGGIVGPVDINSIPKEIADKINNLKVGDISEPFKTSMGYEIVKLESYDKKEKSPKVNFRHILIKIKEGGEDKALEIAKKALSLINKGVDFSIVANQFTEDASNFKNGDIPTFPFSGVYYAISDAAYNLDIGEVSKPIKTKFGFFIIKLLKKESLEENKLESLKKNDGFLKSISRVKTSYIQARNEYAIRRKIRESFDINANYSLLTNRGTVKNDAVVASIKELKFKVIYGQVINFISGVFGPTFNSDFISKQQKVYNTLIFPEIIYQYALKKGYDKENEFVSDMDDYLYNKVYQDVLNAITFDIAEPTNAELKEYYKKNESRYYITKFENGSPKRVKQSFKDAYEILKRDYIQEKRGEKEKEWLKGLRKKYHFKIYSDRLKLEKNYKYYISIGDEYYNQKNYDKAEKYYSKGFELNGESGEAKLKLGLVYYKLNQIKKATEEFDSLSGTRGLNAGMVLSLLKNETGKVRVKLIEVLGFLRDSMAIEPLIDIYNNESSSIVEKQACVRALGFLQSEKSFNILISDLKNIDRKFKKYSDKDRQILKWYIIEALGYIGKKEAIPILSDMYKRTKDENEKCFIIEAFGKIKDKRTVPLLESAYKNEVWGVKVLAAEALQKITGKEYKVNEPKKN